MNSIQLIDCCRANDFFFKKNLFSSQIFLKQFLLYSCKRTLTWQKNIRDFLKNFFEYYFFNIMVNINSFCDLSITVNTTLKYYYMQALDKKLKLMGGAMKYFFTKLLGHEIFSSMVPWAMRFFLRNF